jgi:hypothetical protein
MMEKGMEKMIEGAKSAEEKSVFFVGNRVKFVEIKSEIFKKGDGKNRVEWKCVVDI